MTSEGNLPFLLRPPGKDYLWGGTRLRDDFNKQIGLTPLAETWECSTHPDGESVVASGEYEGRTLREVLTLREDFLGTHPFRTGRPGELPILIKFIDARKDLSIQVHPTDEYAAEHEGGQLGKTEMWYVLDAKKDAQLIYGFYHDIDRETLKKSAEDGSIEKYLQKVKVQKDDVFYIEAGTVHGIGEGILIVEVQESSNLTYRLYDYGRLDKDGKPRQLHLDKALEAANLKGSAGPRQPLRVLNYRPGWAQELLCRCRYFQAERVLLNTERVRTMAQLSTKSNSFEVLLCLDGCAAMVFEGGAPLFLFRGDCVFLPASSVPVRLHGKAQFLKVGC